MHPQILTFLNKVENTYHDASWLGQSHSYEIVICANLVLRTTTLALYLELCETYLHGLEFSVSPEFQAPHISPTYFLCDLMFLSSGL